jgi:hypothetical protein
MRQNFLCLTLLFTILLAGGSCNLPEGPDYGKGTLTLLLPETLAQEVPVQGTVAQNKAGSRSVLSDEARAGLIYKLSFTGPGESQTLEAGGGGITISLDAGQWTVKAEAYKLYDPTVQSAPYNPDELIGSGSAVITVIAGRNNSVRIPMRVDPQYESSLTDIYIHNEEDLRRVGAAENGLAIDNPNRTFHLENDITLNNWTPIGNKDVPFKANFEGNEKIITINSFTDASLAGEYLGLFGYTEGAAINNLTLRCNLGTDSAPLDLTVPSGSEGVFYVGALAGYAEDSVFENISVSGSIKVISTDTKRIELGGIVGAYSSSSGDAIDSSHVRADLFAEGQQDGVIIGGVVGNAGGTIKESSFTGTLQGKGSGVHVGGIAGDNVVNSTITACYASGVIIADAEEEDAYAGGIAGYNSNRVAHCYAGVNISASAVDNVYVGGIVGYLWAGTDPILLQCYALGSIAATGDATKKYVGGIAGYNEEGAIKFCAALNTSISCDSPSGLNWIAGGKERSMSFEDNFFADELRSSSSATSNDSELLGTSSPRMDFQDRSSGVYGAGKLNWTFDTPGSGWDWINGYDYPVLYWQTEPPQSPALLP